MMQASTWKLQLGSPMPEPLPGLGPLGLRVLGESGPAVVLAHGLGRPTVFWEPLARPLSRTCRVFLLDNPGIGTSREARVPRTIEGHAELYAETLLAAGVLGPVNLVGLSLGGMIVCPLAVRLGERCSSLSVLASSSRESGFFRLCPLGLMRILGRLALLKGQHAATLPELCSGELQKGHPKLARSIRRIEKEQGYVRGTMLRQLLAANRFRLRPHLSGLPSRRQVIVGARDGLVPTSNSRRLARLMDAPLHVLEHRGHDLSLDGGPELLKLIEGLVSGPPMSP